MAVEQRSIEPANGLDWATFLKSEAWHNLTAKQQTFLQSYVTTGDGLMATRAAFKSSDKNLRNMMWKTLRNDYVKAALDKWKGRDERQVFLDQLKAKIDACEDSSIAQAKNLALYARLAFDVVEPNVPEESGRKSSSGQAGPRFKVGDPIIVDGVKRRVTAVDGNGHATDVTDEAVE
jgi:hypothetical protein